GSQLCYEPLPVLLEGPERLSRPMKRAESVGAPRERAGGEQDDSAPRDDQVWPARVEERRDRAGERDHDPGDERHGGDHAEGDRDERADQNLTGLSETQLELELREVPEVAEHAIVGSGRDRDGKSPHGGHRKPSEASSLPSTEVVGRDCRKYH